MTGRRSVVLTLLFLLSCAPPVPADGATTPEDEIERLLADRPGIAASLESRPEVRAWILERFRVQRPPLRWDDAPPVSGRLAEWDARDLEVIWLRVDARSSGIDQLVFLLFELHNAQRYDAFDEIHEGAIRGEVLREDYATRMLKEEFEALRAARALYRKHLSELSPREEREARVLYRLVHGTDSFDQHLAENLKRGGDLKDHFRALYDTEVLRERSLRENSKQAP